MIRKQLFIEEIDRRLKANNNLKPKVDDVVDCFLESLEYFLLDGKKVIFQNLSSFDIANRGSRTGVNPLTGAKVIIPERKVLTLKVSSKLKEKINT